MQVILFTTAAPDPLASALIHQGREGFEALSLSEVFALAKLNPSATIIITADIDRERAKTIQEHNPTLQLKGAATVEDVLWELSMLSPGTTIQ